MPERRPLVAANWKMNKGVSDAQEFMERFVGAIGGLEDVEVVICAPFTTLAKVVEWAKRTPVRVGAQNMHFEPKGAFTGEVSASMLTDLGVEAVVLGHSERREHFGESDEALARKLPAALDGPLLPILCVGESESQRDAGATEAVLSSQLEVDLSEVPAGRLAEVVIAYEPIWAIGTGRTATAEQAQGTIAFIRDRLAEHDAEGAASVRILYGGSMKPGNAAELISQPDIDGGLVGGASLDPDDFLGICRAASETAP